MITIDISKQALEYKGKSYSISTAKNGIGEIEDSYCTPTGKFKQLKLPKKLVLILNLVLYWLTGSQLARYIMLI